ncbi:DUF3786 domain-containing protein [Desulfoluna spongiiphila]|uniref:DUF3786 domain-containing protein n=1 Tax=Desulfoluna spongiiphila TaxID=419481 RepID=UPI0012597AA1|nr:DUF3786 domain-containing protein [Desulfoluna spongiiphila]VVS93760.1 4fe-4s domain [Desulfoluna spongiiphila]
MALSVVDLYRDILPKTNCGECGHPTCIAFAGQVVADGLSLSECPYLSSETVERCSIELEEQYAKGKWTRRDMAEDALAWARERASSMAPATFPARLGGELVMDRDVPVFHLPYFTDTLLIRELAITTREGLALTRWEQVFILNHLAQGGTRRPTGRWKGFIELPNTTSKIKNMVDSVEEPIARAFSDNLLLLKERALDQGGTVETENAGSADIAFLFSPFPRVPVILLFWDADMEEGFEAKAKLMFDETVTDHLDIESVVFLGEELASRLVEPKPQQL